MFYAGKYKQSYQISPLSEVLVERTAMHTTTYIGFFAQYAGSVQGRNGGDRGDHLNHPLPQSAD